MQPWHGSAWRVPWRVFKRGAEAAAAVRACLDHVACVRQRLRGVHAAAGINNNAYQISRGLTLNERVGHGVAERCNFLKADFMEMPVQAGTYGERHGGAGAQRRWPTQMPPRKKRAARMRSGAGGKLLPRNLLLPALNVLTRLWLAVSFLARP